MTRPNEERKAAVVHSACLPASLSRSLLSPSPPISSVFAHSEKHSKKAASRSSQSTCDAPRLLSCDLLRRSEGARHACTRTSCVVHRGRAGGRVGGSLGLPACGAGWPEAGLLDRVGTSHVDTPSSAARLKSRTHEDTNEAPPASSLRPVARAGGGRMRRMRPVSMYTCS